MRDQNVIYKIASNNLEKLQGLDGIRSIESRTFASTEDRYLLVRTSKNLYVNYGSRQITIDKDQHHLTITSTSINNFANDYHYTIELEWEGNKIKVHFSFDSNGVRSALPGVRLAETGIELSGNKKKKQKKLIPPDLLPLLENGFYDNYENVISKIFEEKEKRIKFLKTKLFAKECLLLNPEDVSYSGDLEEVLATIKGLNELGVITPSENLYNHIKKILDSKQASLNAKTSQDNDFDSELKEESSSEPSSVVTETNVKPILDKKKTEKPRINLEEEFKKLKPNNIKAMIDFISRLNGAELLGDESIETIASIRNKISENIREYFDNKENIPKSMRVYISAIKEQIIIDFNKEVVLKHVLKNDNFKILADFLNLVSVSQFELMELEPGVSYTIMEWALHYKADTCLVKLINKGFNLTSTSSLNSPLTQLFFDSRLIDDLPKLKEKLRTNNVRRLMELLKRHINPELHEDYDNYTKSVLALNLREKRMRKVQIKQGENYISGYKGFFNPQEVSKLLNDKDYLTVSAMYFNYICISGDISNAEEKRSHRMSFGSSSASNPVALELSELKVMEYSQKADIVIKSMIIAVKSYADLLKPLIRKVNDEMKAKIANLKSQLTEILKWEKPEQTIKNLASKCQLNIKINIEGKEVIRKLSLDDVISLFNNIEIYTEYEGVIYLTNVNKKDFAKYAKSVFENAISQISSDSNFGEFRSSLQVSALRRFINIANKALECDAPELTDEKLKPAP